MSRCVVFAVYNVASEKWLKSASHLSVSISKGHIWVDSVFWYLIKEPNGDVLIAAQNGIRRALHDGSITQDMITNEEIVIVPDSGICNTNDELWPAFEDSVAFQLI